MKRVTNKMPNPREVWIPGSVGKCCTAGLAVGLPGPRRAEGAGAPWPWAGLGPVLLGCPLWNQKVPGRKHIACKCNCSDFMWIASLCMNEMNFYTRALVKLLCRCIRLNWQYWQSGIKLNTESYNSLGCQSSSVANWLQSNVSNMGYRAWSSSDELHSKKCCRWELLSLCLTVSIKEFQSVKAIKAVLKINLFHLVTFLY